MSSQFLLDVHDQTSLRHPNVYLHAMKYSLSMCITQPLPNITHFRQLERFRDNDALLMRHAQLPLDAGPRRMEKLQNPFQRRGHEQRHEEDRHRHALRLSRCRIEHRLGHDVPGQRPEPELLFVQRLPVVLCDLRADARVTHHTKLVSG